MSSKTRTIARQKEEHVNGERRVAKAVHQEIYQGPLPLAEDFAKYESVCPGAADRIIAMAERQSQHRQSIEKSVVNAGNRNSVLGIISATFIAISVLIGGVYCVLQGHDTAGTAIVTIDLVGLCGVFIYGTNMKNK